MRILQVQLVGNLAQLRSNIAIWSGYLLLHFKTPVSYIYIYSDQKLINIAVHLDLDIATCKSKAQFVENSKNISLGHISKPATIVDKYGRILVWYLPKILTEDHHVSKFTNVFVIIFI